MISPFNISIISNGRIIPKRFSENGIVGEFDKTSYGILDNSIWDGIVNLGIHKTDVFFKTDTGSFIISAPAGFLVNHENFEMFLNFLTDQYGEVQHMALGDIDFTAWINAEPENVGAWIPNHPLFYISPNPPR